MPLIKIGIKGLAKFMTSSAATQRKVIADYKNPDPEGKAQAKYYRDARGAIAKLHREGRDMAWLESQAAALVAEAQAAKTDSKIQIASRLKNNARALRHYVQKLGHLKYVILPDVTLALNFGDVQISVSPDLHVSEGNKEKLLKFDFSEQEPDQEVIRIMTQGLFEAANVGGMALPSSHVLYVDVPRGAVHKGARVGARMRTNIEAACKTIQAIWPTIEIL